ncbi:MAG: TPM domain-containing protein [Clostridia bacterium]|nr:TPM domain-containing protein [Clostridia bacterium]
MKKVLSVIFISAILAALLVTLASASSRPDWYPDNIYRERFHGKDLPKVVDYAGIFTDAEEAALTGKINEYVEKYGYDLVIVTDVSNYNIGSIEEQYAIDFYYYNGYGIDDDYSGSVIYINMDPNDRYVSNVGTGKIEKYYTRDTVNKMQDITYPYLSDGEYAKAMSVNIDLIDELTATGKITVKRSVGDYIMPAGIAVLVGLIAGAISSSSAKASMNNVKFARYASDYMVKDSFVLRGVTETFLYKNVTRTYIPPSSSSGGGGSSYHGGSSSSGGGGSFSGGSRHF